MEMHIAVATEMLEQLDFAQSSLGQDLLTEDIGHLLHGHALASLYVGCRTETMLSVITAATIALFQSPTTRYHMRLGPALW